MAIVREAARARGWLRRLFGGSVADAVTSQGGAPVLADALTGRVLPWPIETIGARFGALVVTAADHNR